MPYFTIVIAILAVLIAWGIISYLTSRAKEPDFIVVETRKGYEIRQYVKYIEARVSVEGDDTGALRNGFRILAGYIFGGNTSTHSLAMTVPVIEQQQSEKLAMTVPVTESKGSKGQHIISFVMPSDQTMATLPIPTDKRIELVEVPAHRTAVLCYSWPSRPNRTDAKKKELLSYLSRDKCIPLETPRCARYNPPWAAPYMIRNEIMVNI